MPRARISYGLLTSQNQGGGQKKQGLPPTVGLGHFSMNIIQRKAGYCRCNNSQSNDPFAILLAGILSIFSSASAVQIDDINATINTIPSLALSTETKNALIDFYNKVKAMFTYYIIFYTDVINSFNTSFCEAYKSEYLPLNFSNRIL